MATAEQADAEASDFPPLDEILQNWPLGDSSPDFDPSGAISNMLGSPALTNDLSTFPVAAEASLEASESPPTSGPSTGDVWSTTDAFSGSCTTASSLIPDWPSPREAFLHEFITSEDRTGHDWPLKPPGLQLASSQIPQYSVPVSHPEIPKASMQAQPSHGAPESMNLEFISTLGGSLDDPALVLAMLPSWCDPLTVPSCSRTDPVYHMTANGFEICQQPIMHVVPSNSPTGARLTNPFSSSSDESLHQIRNDPDADGRPQKLSARERRKRTRPEKCSVPGCSARFAYARGLARHIAAKHKELAPSLAKLPCKYPGCNKLFARGDHVTRHWKRKHGALATSTGPSSHLPPG
jgi:hypothetical protein